MNVLLATLAILFATAIMPRQSSAGEANSKDIRFEIDQVLSCAKSKEVDLCLNKIFGASIGYEIFDGKEIRSINFPRMKNGSLVLNGLKLDGLFNPSIVFYPKEKVYSICGPKQPVTIGRFKFGSESRCICGLNSRGEFNWRLDYHWPFLPEKLRLAIGSMSCGEKNEFSTNGLNILEIISGDRHTAYFSRRDVQRIGDDMKTLYRWLSGGRHGRTSAGCNGGCTVLVVDGDLLAGHIRHFKRRLQRII